MAVESVVSFLVSKINSLLKGDAEEGKLINDVRAEVRKIRDELEMMRAFLRDADARADTDEVVKTWVKQVREAAYDIEDVVDEFVLFQAQETNRYGSQILYSCREAGHICSRCEQIKRSTDTENVVRGRRNEIKKAAQDNEDVSEEFEFIEASEPDHHGQQSTDVLDEFEFIEDPEPDPHGQRYADALDEFELIEAQEPYHQDHRFTDPSREAVRAGSKRKKIIKKLLNQMRELGSRVVDISARRERYSFNIPDQGSTSSTLDDRTSDLRSIARFSNEDDLVGTENPRNHLIRWLVGGESMQTTIAIVGMGGLGKTTLAGKVYYSDRVKKHFECRAWVTVSQSFQLEDVFRSMVKEFCGSSIQGAEDMEMGKLIETLEEVLRRKRYIIVLDDVWKVDDWKRVKSGLPDGKAGSRIMVTTREIDVASSCSETSRIYDLQPLSFEDGWALFCKKAFRSEFAGQRGCCPPDLKELSEKIVEKCRGLPLAIVAIGSLLSLKKRTPIEWQNVYNGLRYQMESNPDLNTMKKILLLSINDLSYNLKSCFFYLSIFPEDYSIEPKRLVRLWIAEGFVGENEGRTLEDVAYDYLQELINRSLIQVAWRTEYGKLRACRVHDIVHEMIILKSKEWNFTTSFQKENMRWAGEIRRLSIHYIDETLSMSKDLFWSLSSCLRTLVIFPVNFAKKNLPFPKLRLLKVLNLEGADIERFPDEIIDLLLLRFLSLRRTRISELPSSIGKLTKLETLDLRQTRVSQLPTNICKLSKLRHLLVYYDHIGYHKGGVKVEGGVLGSFKSLQKLAYIDAGSRTRVMREVRMLTQLRTLGIRNLLTEHGVDLCVSLGNMMCLNKLTVSLPHFADGHLNLEFVSSAPPLEHLCLEGRLTKKLPHWIPSLSNLIRLELKNSCLSEDPFEALQYLPNLTVLYLRGAYDGKMLHCKSGGFQRLNSLSLIELTQLKTVSVDEGAMPCLQKLILRECFKLQKVPLGIEHLVCLKEIVISMPSSELYRSISIDGGEDYWKISHIPVKHFL